MSFDDFKLVGHELINIVLELFSRQSLQLLEKHIEAVSVFPLGALLDNCGNFPTEFSLLALHEENIRERNYFECSMHVAYNLPEGLEFG